MIGRKTENEGTIKQKNGKIVSQSISYITKQTVK